MVLVKIPWWIKKLFYKIIWSLPGHSKTLYLTFDDGPIPETTPWIIDTLDKYNIKATFFCVGNNVKKNTELYNRIIESGHSIGNHTFSHMNGWKSGIKEYISDVERAEKYINSNLFRPPHGKMRSLQKRAIRKKFRIVMWDVLSKDYDMSLDKWTILENVINNARAGSVIVFHDNIKAKENLKFVLPKLIEHYLYKKYSFRKLNFENP